MNIPIRIVSKGQLQLKIFHRFYKRNARNILGILFFFLITFSITTLFNQSGKNLYSNTFYNIDTSAKIQINSVTTSKIHFETICGSFYYNNATIVIKQLSSSEKYSFVFNCDFSTDTGDTPSYLTLYRVGNYNITVSFQKTNFSSLIRPQFTLTIKEYNAGPELVKYMENAYPMNNFFFIIVLLLPFGLFIAVINRMIGVL